MSDKELLESFHNKYKNHKDLQRALKAYLYESDLVLTGREKYCPGIDCVSVSINDDVVFWIGLPPVSDYPVEETEHTRKYLRKRPTFKPVAVASTG